MRLAILAAQAVLVFAFTHLTHAAPAPATTASARLAALLASADEDDLRLNPQNGLTRGDMRYAREFGDLISDAYFRRAEAQLVKQLAALSAIDRSALSPQEQIAYDVFAYNARFALGQHRDGTLRVAREMPLDHVWGQHLQFLQLSSGGGAAPYRTVADYDAGLARFDGFVVYLDRSIARMKQGLRNGHVQPRVVTQKIVAQLDTELANAPEKSPLYQPILAFPDTFSPADKARLEKAYRQAITTKVHPALKRVRTFMAGDYLAAGRTERPGLAGIPGGRAYYRSMLEQWTTTRLTPDEIHALGLADVARIRQEMDDVRAKVGFTGDYPAFVRHLQSDPRFQYPTEDALVEAYRKVQADAEARLPQYFATLPRSKLEIRPVPPEQQASASGAYYIVGTPDGARPGVFFVNTSNLPTRTSPRVTALFLHEGVPGHHLQGSLAAENTALPAILRFGWNPGYGEGWALYAEWLGQEMGLYGDPYQYFGRLDMEMLRAVRMVVDTGLHEKGWGREQTIDYMLANTTLDRAAVEQEVDRYLVWPGQAPSYKVGEITLRRLRSEAERALGSDFDVRRFHAAVLDTGALPLHVLEAKVAAWIAVERQRTSPTKGKP